MAILKGYAIPVQGWRSADHTYVTSSDGKRWPCWGRDRGGHEICSGPGSSAVADCLSQPNSHAGIVYGITGVCHQTANRILDPAGVLVSQAHGYRYSMFAFHTYGLGNWPQRQACGSVGSAMKKRRQASGGRLKGTPKSKESRFVRRIRAVYGDAGQKLAGPDEASLSRAELDAMWDVFLGENYDPNKRQTVIGLQSQMRQEQRELEKKFRDKKLSGQEYLEKANRLFADTFIECERILGSDDASKLFGVSPSGVGDGLIDPDTFLKTNR